LGSTGLIGYLARVGGSRNVEHSTRGDINPRLRRFLHLPGYSTAAAFNRRAGLAHKGHPPKGNPLSKLGMQIAFTLPMTMLLLVPVTEFHLNLFYPAFLILLGAHYLPFVFLYGMRIFIPLCAILVSSGIAIALYLPQSFCLGAWVGGLTLFVFAWIGRAVVQSESRAKAW
jgi:hypothetical protein